MKMAHTNSAKRIKKRPKISEHIHLTSEHSIAFSNDSLIFSLA